MNPFKRIGAGIAAGFQRAGAAIQRAVRQIIPRRPQATEPEIPTATKSAIREKARQRAEQEAYDRALWAIQNAMENPDDLTAQLAKDKAIEYLNRSKDLSKKGSLQDANRETIARRWIESELSSKEGQEERFNRQLETFNNNFNIKLTRDTYKTMKNIMDTPSFKKLLEQNRGMYELIFGTVGDQVEAGVDPKRIEQTLEVFSRFGMDSFETFKDITDLPTESYRDLMEDINLLEESAFFDEFDRKEAFEGVLGRYIEW